MPNIIFFYPATRPLNAHHYPLFIGAGPNRCISKCVMKSAENCFCFIHLQLIERKPERRNSAFLEPALHKREELLSVQINGARYFRRRRFSRNDVIFPRAGLQEEATVLNKRGYAR